MSASSLICKPRKVGIIGNGHVGSHVAYSLALQGIADEIYLADIDKNKSTSQMLDLQDSVTYLSSHRVLVFSCDVNDLGDCDVIVLAAGPLPLPDESRLATLPRTMEVLNDILHRLQSGGVMASFTGVLVSISNPADVVAAYMQRALQLPARRVICTGTCLDSARLQALLATTLKDHVHPRSLQSAYMLGEHGDSCIVAWSQVSVGTKRLDQLQKEQPEKYPTFDRAAMQTAVHRRGYEVLVGKGSTEFGIATAAAEVIKAILHNEHKVLPCSVLLQGEYEETDVFASVPVIVGARGVEEILGLDLSEEEKLGFHHSCEVIRSYIQKAIEIRPL